MAVMICIGTIEVNAQQVALKTNLLYDAATTPNLGMEVGVGKKHSVQVFYGLNPWKFGSGDDQKYLKHWVINPEWRHWFCHRFNGSFVGIHALGGQFDALKIKTPFGWWKELEDHRFEGWFIGGGISYGYQWVMSKHWNFEAAIGVGAAYIKYDKFGCGTCGKKLGDGDKIYIGPTKLALSLMYLF
ncbi:MAG: DUF3575 domain-containing protein [Prevotella sp.]|nr:DUF3575 domain-containing protein [Prevotella sp.]